MRNYIIRRILKSIVSIFIVVSIVITMLFTMIPRMKVFNNDGAYNKLSGDSKTVYAYTKLEELGYLDYVRQTEMCEVAASNYNACINNDKSELQKVSEYYQNDGYTVEIMNNGTLFAYHDYSVFEILVNYYKSLIRFDNPNFVYKSYGVELEKTGYYFGKDNNGVPALMCNGCEYKYQVYFDSSVPFIHTNMVHLNFGNSFPTKAGMPTLDVIGNGQGETKQKEVTFETGKVMNSPLNVHTAKYKTSLDATDSKKFNDNYADCKSYYSAPSMINMSYLMGIIAIVIEYLIAIPAGILMSRKKDKLADRIGLVYINLLNSLPSLAFIFFMRQVGMTIGLPASFPQLGYSNVKSYFLPILILALLSTPSLMTWTRRYMIDQSNSDYAKFARAKGLSEKEVFNKHILKNAIIPIVNGIPASIILCISGAFITESAFSVPGMGKMLPDAIKLTNNNMVITLVFIFTTLSVFSVLLGDILMTIVDPRIKLTSSKGN